MSIGCIGAHRSGKTTLAKALSAYFNLPFYNGSFGDMAKRLGYTSSVADMTLQERAKMQYDVLGEYTNEVRAMQKQQGPIITDRTPIDMMAYMLAECGMHDGAGSQAYVYVEDCIRLTHELFSGTIMIFPLETYEQDEGKPPLDAAYQRHIHYLMAAGLQDMQHRYPEDNALILRDRDHDTRMRKSGDFMLSVFRTRTLST